MEVRKPARTTEYSASGEGAIHPDLAFERHYSVAEVVELWGLSEKTVRRIFGGEPGVLEWGHDEERFKRGYRTLRIPESVVFTGVRPARTTVQSVLGERIKVEIDALHVCHAGDRSLWDEGIWLAR